MARMSSWSVLRLFSLLAAAAVCAVSGSMDLPGSLDPSLLENVDVDQLRSNYLPPGLQNTNLTVDDLQKLLQSKCQKANDHLPPGSVNATALSKTIEQSTIKLFECLSGLANVTEIQAEIAEATPKGDLDVVFEKYCLRMPQAKGCLKDFNDAILPCLTADEKRHNGVLQRIADKLLEFICYKNGDQIALFIAEKGPECLTDSRDGIANCLNASFASYLPKEFSPEWNLPQLVLGPKQCVDLYEFETCTVNLLEKCEVITPSNIVESMFRYVRRESSCQPHIDRAKQQHRRAAPLVGVAGSGSSLHCVHLRWILASLLMATLLTRLA
ncbi:27 kDa hemolymph glycoprotein [Drosophila elegans]|uniref:27 kDa hemolymph glycoprotein n=1 Tax=Drosophila elegans TaxID=30023 RepID=UPI0007E697A4|nr:27 kDa hemolymph glycoprotein [Drosophila elegans]